MNYKKISHLRGSGWGVIPTRGVSGAGFRVRVRASLFWDRFAIYLLTGSLFLSAGTFGSRIYYVVIIGFMVVFLIVTLLKAKSRWALTTANLPIYLLMLAWFWLAFVSVLSADIFYPARALISTGYVTLLAAVLVFYKQRDFLISAVVRGGIFFGVLYVVAIIAALGFDAITLERTSTFASEIESFGNRNAIANKLFALSVFLVLGHMVGLLSAKLTFALLSLTALFIFMSFSAKASLGIMLIFAAFLMSSAESFKRIFFVTIAVSFVFFFVVANATGFEQAVLRLLALFGIESGHEGAAFAEATTAGRRSMLTDGWRLFLENPIIGIGLENTRGILRTYTHFDILELLVSGGLFAFIFYYSAYYLVVRRVYRAKYSRSFRVALLLILAAILLFGQATAMYRSAYLLVPLFLVYVIALADLRLPPSRTAKVKMQMTGRYQQQGQGHEVNGLGVPRI